MTVSRHSGVRIEGGVALGEPSPDGTWSPTLDEDYVDFDRDEFTRFVDRKGDVVLWESAAFCPNRGGVTPDAHVIGCKVCGGGGFVFFGGQQTKMLVQTATLKELFFAYGRWDRGAAMITALPGTRLSYFDRVTLLNRRVRFTETLRRQPLTTIDRPKFDIVSIEYVSWVNRSGQLRVFTLNGVAPDCAVTADGQIQWKNMRPDDNAYYTVSYVFLPKYRVTDLPHHHRSSTNTVEVPPALPGQPSTIANNQYEYPVQALATQEFLVRDEGRDAPQVEDKNPFDGTP